MAERLMHPPADYAPRPDLLAGRTLLITGATAGIGRAAALACARHGARLVLLGRRAEALEAVADTIETAGGAPPLLQPLDFATSGDEQFQSLATAMALELDALHGILHSAGTLGELTPVEHYGSEMWQRVMQVNLNAGFILTRELLPLLKAAEDASVVFTSSGVGRRGRAFWGAYAVSKFAVEGLTQVLADELERTSQIRVNAINPGATRTAMRAAAFPGENPADLKPPEALMPTYLYLLGSDSRPITGASFEARQSDHAKASSP